MRTGYTDLKRCLKPHGCWFYWGRFIVIENVVASSATPLQMWVVLALVAGSLVLYGLERISLELTSMALIATLLLFFEFFPLLDGGGQNLLGAGTIMSGFANPALLTVLSLLVVGQGAYWWGQ